MKVTEIIIENLFGKDYIIPIKDNKLILIGVNGTCKSIILSIISDLLQKEKISNHTFDRAYVSIDDVNYEVLNNDRRLKYPRNYPEQDVLYVCGNLNDFFSMRPKNKEVIPIINKYFSDSNKTFNICSEGYINIKEKGNDNIIGLSDLSKGEKKIIKFMTFFYSIKEPISLIIDNPEEYLSVRWQKMFLDDIVNSGMCDLLITTTHSPFIYNKLEGYRLETTRLIKDKS